MRRENVLDGYPFSFSLSFFYCLFYLLSFFIECGNFWFENLVQSINFADVQNSYSVILALNIALVYFIQYFLLLLQIRRPCSAVPGPTLASQILKTEKVSFLLLCERFTKTLMFFWIFRSFWRGALLSWEACGIFEKILLIPPLCPETHYPTKFLSEILIESSTCSPLGGPNKKKVFLLKCPRICFTERFSFI